MGRKRHNHHTLVISVFLILLLAGGFYVYNKSFGTSFNLNSARGGTVTPPATSNYVATFKAQNVGFIRWSYDPLDVYQLEDVNYNPTNNMIWLLQAMAQ